MNIWPAFPYPAAEVHEDVQHLFMCCACENFAQQVNLTPLATDTRDDADPTVKVGAVCLPLVPLHIKAVAVAICNCAF